MKTIDTSKADKTLARVHAAEQAADEQVGQVRDGIASMRDKLLSLRDRLGRAVEDGTADENGQEAYQMACASIARFDTHIGMADRMRLKPKAAE